MLRDSQYWAVIPAAGAGARMGADRPKQYLRIGGKCLLAYALEHFCRHPRITGVVVALAEGDPYWPGLPISTHEKIIMATGGEQRCHSVLNSLRRLAHHAQPDDWVLVHDAARPCLRSEDIDYLMQELAGHPVGGLLALPVQDTMKRADSENEISETVDRQGLWHALTPQMFRFAKLTQALTQAIGRDQMVTDEAQAMELSGVRPKLLTGHPGNIKVTHRGDLPVAELFLLQQEGRK
ncbi:MAG: 2-C-methyl-D-erythritol 4-phosphate cytidylyltransferase [Gammaproteobacteria bacterium]